MILRLAGTALYVTVVSQLLSQMRIRRVFVNNDAKSQMRGASKALPNTKGKTAFNLHNKNISPSEFLLVSYIFIESSKTLS